MSENNTNNSAAPTTPGATSFSQVNSQAQQPAANTTPAGTPAPPAPVLQHLPTGNFGTLYDAQLTHAPEPTGNAAIAAFVAKLRHPGHGFYNEAMTHITFSLPWVIGVLGPEHFDTIGGTLRRVYNPTDDLQGVDLVFEGLPQEVWEWLSSNPIPETVTFPVSVFDGSGNTTSNA